MDWVFQNSDRALSLKGAQLGLSNPGLDEPLKIPCPKFCPYRPGFRQTNETEVALNSKEAKEATAGVLLIRPNL